MARSWGASATGGCQRWASAIEQVTQGTLDRGLCHDRETLGPERAAREEYHAAQALRYEPAWWQLAYTHGGALVGLVMPAVNDGGPIIYYIGVVPEYRGQGYVNDLLTQGTKVLQEAGATRIVSDSDKVNVPMARAFERADYAQAEHHFQRVWRSHDPAGGRLSWQGGGDTGTAGRK